MSLRELLKTHRLWFTIAAWCLVPAGLSSFTVYVNSRLAGRPGWADAILTASLWLVFAILTLIPYRFARRFPLKRERLVHSLPAHVVGALLMSFCWAAAGSYLAVYVVRVRVPQVSFVRYIASSFLTNLSIYVLLYFATLGGIYAFSYYREARDREAREARLTAQLAEARLSALRMQLNPHFLFNSLNAIIALVADANIDQSTRMLQLLSSVLRQVLKQKDRPEVPLNEEIEFIEKYLAIEQVRFSDRLQVRFSIDPLVNDAQVPEFILQPLVENAIRHGIARIVELGMIRVAARAEDGYLIISVEDNGPGSKPGPAGLGLENTRERLQTLYGSKGHLELATGVEGGTIATVTFPLRRASSE